MIPAGSHQIPTCWRCVVVGGGDIFLMVVSLREMARVVSYYLCFPPPAASANGICLKLNNSSIKCQVRNKKLNTRPLKLASQAERWNFSCLRLKAHSSRWKWKRMRHARRGRGKIVDGRKTKKHRIKTEVAGSQSGSYTVNKISPQGA